MAVTIASVTPSSGITGGRGQILIVGTGFDGLTNKMTVELGGAACVRTRVRDGVTNTDGTLLDCRIPPCPLVVPGKVNVRVVNDFNSQEVTLVDAYEYERPDLAVRSHLMLVWRALVERLRLHVLEETVMASTSREYARVGENGVSTAKVPAIVVEGPALVDSEHESFHNEVDTLDIPGLTFERQRETQRVDVEFDIVILDRLDTDGGGGNERAMTLVQWVEDHFLRNPDLDVARLDSDPTDTIKYEMMIVSHFQPDEEQEDPGLIAWRGIFKVEAVGVEVRDTIEEGVLFGVATNPTVTLNTTVPGTSVLKQ